MFDPYPVPALTDDFGGVGLIQTPTARFSPDGQLSAGYNEVAPYDRYFVTLQATSWLEATLRYTSVRNRLYSDVPAFSGNQSYKDRGFDLKLKLLGEGRIRPAIAFGLRDFVGTGLFSSEYLVANKSFGPFDASFGIGWGNLATRGPIRNPFTYISSSFDNRPTFSGGGGEFNNTYFKGRRAGLFGGIQYATPIRGLSLKVEYDPNNYQSEALGNRLRDRAPVNAALDYRVFSWLHAAASFERGDKVGLTFTATTNFNRQTEAPKYDPPAPPIGVDAQPTPPTVLSAPPPAQKLAAESPVMPSATPTRAPAPVAPVLTSDGARVQAALSTQGATLFAANFSGNSAELFVTQNRFLNVATGLGRVARAAYSVLPAKFTSLTIVFVENGLRIMAVTVPREGLIEAVNARRGEPVDALLKQTEFAPPPAGLDNAEYQGDVRKAYPHFYYALRPGLKTTFGRPEAFVLYDAFAAFNGGLSISRGLGIDGQFTLNLADNFDRLRLQSDSSLPHVRTDIAQYLSKGKTAITHLQADYNFNIAPNLYGHAYGGLLEEMFAGVGGEVLWRPYNSSFALGIEGAYVAQRGYDQLFDLRQYRTFTGFVSAYYTLPGNHVDASVKVGRYLARDFGATFELSRRFESGVRVGAFATFTNISAARFGEGSFDKGFYLSIPLDLLYTRHVRSSIGVEYRPLIRDGGAQLIVRQPLIGTTDAMREGNFDRDWDGLTN
ncbi:YjbH domain-containing protein [Polymorphobacter sp. PAMC 29334]|uniref:YjbH domain-containing protein n=1 Tax=Polymorphobacter sp. PAMC 29334 TaxID=2862331 RepID=UPI001C67E057|nr:YjbH domain-containing protein [Polymorphobacter sp. PAMC 29334]QYE36045.1 YjbH domain-containing protein [Polymorphobacter sp. PAMC 29334]